MMDALITKRGEVSNEKNSGVDVDVKIDMNYISALKEGNSD